MDDAGPPATRRAALATCGGIAASSLAGCADRLWSQAETPGADQVSLSIKFVPAETDPFASLIASRLRENYTAAGIDVSPLPVSNAELYREVLLENDFDVFVARYPGFDEYDALYGLLHSKFVSEGGWQNPFQFADLTIDEHLEQQRDTAVDDRSEELAELIEFLLETTPYTAVVHPYRISGVTTQLEVPAPPHDPPGYVDILSQSANGPRDGPLEIGVFGDTLSERLNPLTVDQNRIPGLLDLLYDPPVRQIDDGYVPWLAESVEWADDGIHQITLTLRDGLEWHDGESIDTDDIEFTYQLLRDTSLGAADSEIPAHRYRGRQTLVDSTTVRDSQTIEVSVPNTPRAVARRVLTIPVLPEHIWADRAELIADRQTETLTHDNEEPVGSGLFAVADATPGSEIVLEPFDDHVLREAADRPSLFDDFSQFQGIRFEISPNAGAMVDMILDTTIDLTVGPLSPEHVTTLQEAPDASTTMELSNGFYIIGYNTQHDELSNPNFRRVCSRLIDREDTVDTVFDGVAQAATTPNELVGIHDTQWEDDDLFETQASELRDFPGSNGSVNATRAQSLFQEIGYNYDNDTLLQ